MNNTINASNNRRSDVDSAQNCWRHWSAWGLGGVVALLAAALLYRGIFDAFAQGPDALLYARSLWGVAHGDFVNPVADAHVFAIHANLVLFALAPFVWLMPAALVLILAQAAALGVTLGLVARAFHDATIEAGSSAKWAKGAGLWGGALAVVLSPIVLNPFVFDPRPELIGVPFLVAAHIRMVELGVVDRRVLIYAMAAVLCREEFALVVAATFAFSPLATLPRSARPLLRRRTLRFIAFGLLAYFLAWALGLRFLLGGTLNVAEMHLAGQGELDVPETASTFALFKLEIAAVVATTAGTLIWRGGRWLFGALPGLVFLMANQLIVRHQLNFHYGMLVAPSLIAAALAGYRAWIRAGRPHRHLNVAVWTTIALAAFILEGSAPGGRRFWPRRFDLARDDGSLHFGLATRNPEYVAAHKTIAKMPRSHGVAVLETMGAPLADRDIITSTRWLAKDVEAGRPVRPEIQSVVVRRQEISQLGRKLVHRYGFRLAGLTEGPLEWLTRDPAHVDIPWERFQEPLAEEKCRRPQVSWASAGLELCEALVQPGQRATALIRRRTAGQTLTGVRPVIFLARESGARPMWVAQGLVSLSDLPVGNAVRVFTDEARNDWMESFGLVDGDGHRIPEAPP
ncbi:MAG: DUF2079 domain-containing protein [Deltaproteobacteria bacterium]|nr:DUF2079 domain-containing protein [Deltaproteobacteria bacterium]